MNSTKCTISILCRILHEMALWHIPLYRERNPLDNFFDDVFDWSLSPRYYRLINFPYRKSHSSSDPSHRKVQEDTFKVTLDVRNYQPDDVSLTVEGDKLLVKGKSRTENEFGFETSEFERAYPIPSDVDVKGFQSKINNEGQLEIEAPKIKQEKHQETEQSIQQDDNKFKAVFDVTKYKPEEVSVKVQGNQVIVHGEQKSESKDEDKGIFVHHRQFTRRLVLPETVKLESLQSKWTKNGTLVIEADKCPSIEAEPQQLKIEYECDEAAKMDE